MPKVRHAHGACTCNTESWEAKRHHWFSHRSPHCRGSCGWAAIVAARASGCSWFSQVMDNLGDPTACHNPFRSVVGTPLPPPRPQLMLCLASNAWFPWEIHGCLQGQPRAPIKALNDVRLISPNQSLWGAYLSPIFGGYRCSQTATAPDFTPGLRRPKRPAARKVAQGWPSIKSGSRKQDERSLQKDRPGRGRKAEGDCQFEPIYMWVRTCICWSKDWPDILVAIVVWSVRIDSHWQPIFLHVEQASVLPSAFRLVFRGMCSWSREYIWSSGHPGFWKTQYWYI